VVHCAVLPYRSTRLNRVEFAALTAGFLTLALGVFYTDDVRAIDLPAFALPFLYCRVLVCCRYLRSRLRCAVSTASCLKLLLPGVAFLRRCPLAPR
jgi:hypothetical protein